MLIVGVMEVINLAHGSLFALGAYAAISLIGYKINFYLAILLAPLLVALVGMALEVCMRRTYGKDALYGLLLTFGAALVIEEVIRVIWGSGEKQLLPPPELSGAMVVGGLIYAKYRLYAGLAAIVLIFSLYLFLEKTPYGAMIKAGAHDSEMVRALGINLTRLRLFVFALGTALAAAAGIVLAPIWGVRPHMGVDAVVPAFLIIVLGGVGSFWGAVLAGIMVGVVVGVTGAYASEWSLLSMYLLLIALVTFRARGLFGKKTALEN
jgi:branched-subunit amino acid ABC-type transport system permease component